MPWNPGLSHRLLEITGTRVRSTTDVVGDGRFVQIVESGRPAVILWWTGDVVNPAQARTSFWFNGSAFLDQLPLRTAAPARAAVA